MTTLAPYPTPPIPHPTAQPDPLPASPRTIKLLDTLTNRYYAGMIRDDWGFGLSLEFAPTSQLHAGQGVRFIIAGNHTLIARQDMQAGIITRAHRAARTTQVELAILSDAAAA